MVGGILGSGFRVICMAMVFIPGKMVVGTMASTNLTRSMAKVCTVGLMEEFITVAG